MIQVSSKYWEVIGKRADKVIGALLKADDTELLLNDSNIDNGGLEITKICIPSDELAYGGVIVAQLSLSLRTNENRYLFFDSKASLDYELEVEDGVFEKVHLGKFYIKEAERTNSIVKLVGYNELSKLDKEYNQEEFGGTPFELITDICTFCDIELAMTKEEIEQFPNGKERIQITKDSYCSTYRDCMRVIAQMLCAIVDVNQEDKLVVKPFMKESVRTLTKAERFSSVIDDYVSKYNYLKIKTKSSYFVSEDPAIENGLKMIINRAPAWFYGGEEDLQKRCDAVFEDLKQIVYTPSKFSIISNPAYECGDMLELKLDDDESVTTLITSTIWKYRNKTEIESKGKNPYFANRAAAASNFIQDIQHQTEINKLIFYEFTNIKELKIKQDLISIGKILFTAIEDTSCSFLAEGAIECEVADDISVFEKSEKVVVKNVAGAVVAIKDKTGKPLNLSVPLKIQQKERGLSTLEVFYYLNDSLLTYSPKQDLFTGKHILNLYYVLSLLKKNTVNKFEIKMRASKGVVIIPRNNFKASMSGQGLAAQAPEWDGTLFFEDAMEAIVLPDKVMSDFTDEVNVIYPPQADSTLSDVFAGITFKPMFNLSGELIVNETINHQSIHAEDISYDGNIFELVDGKLKIKTTAPVPQTLTTESYSMAHTSIKGIESAVSTASDDTLYAVSFDGGTTFKAHNGTAWVTVTTNNAGMTKIQLEAIGVNDWKQVITSDNYIFRIVLADTSSYFENLIVNYIN